MIAPVESCPKLADALDAPRSGVPKTPIHFADPAEIRRVRFRKSDGRAFRALVAAARSLLVLRNWASDLIVHDRRSLREQSGIRRFLWSVGTNGTHLVWIDPPAEGWDPRHEATTESDARKLVHAITEARPSLFLWDGVTLQTCDADRAVSLLVGRIADDA